MTGRKVNAMTVLRPYGAEDNEINMTELDVIKHWAERNNEIIKVVDIRTLGVSAEMESGRMVRLNQSNGCRSAYKNIREHLAMYEEIDGKSVRIKKADW